MADPLSITASVIGITVPALHGVRLLLEDLQGLKEAPKTVQRLTQDVQSVEASLKLLQTVEEREWNLLGTEVLGESEKTISSCKQACTLFRNDLQHWTRHSESGKLAWLDRTSVGMFKKGQIKSMSEQLQNCKLSIASIVSTATLYSSVRHTHITEEIRSTISTVQADVESAVTTTAKQLVVLESRLEELNQSSDEDDDAAASQQGKAEALQQLEEERKALAASRTLLDNLLAKAHEDAVAKAAAKSGDGAVTVTFGKNNSGQQIGVNNGGIHGMVFGASKHT